jgi:hypothetical protein
MKQNRSKKMMAMSLAAAVAMGLFVGAATLVSPSNKMANAGAATVSKSVVYDGTHNKASGDVTYSATGDSSMNITGLATTIKTSGGTPNFSANGVFETAASYYNSAAMAGTQHGFSQTISFTTSGLFTSVDIVYSSSVVVSNTNYLPYVSTNSGNTHSYFTKTYATKNQSVSLSVSGLSVNTMSLIVMFAGNEAFTFTLTSFTVHFTSAATC